MRQLTVSGMIICLMFAGMTVLITGNGCQTMTPEASAYQAGRMAAVGYMIGKDAEPEYAQAAQLAYLILDDVVKGRTEFSESVIKEQLRLQAEELGVDRKWADPAYTAFVAFRNRLRGTLAGYDKAVDVYVILEQFRNGINDALSDYGFEEKRTSTDHPIMSGIENN